MEIRTFELEFARFIEKFRDHIREAFLEDTIHKRELLTHYQLGEKMLEEPRQQRPLRIHQDIDKKNLGGDYRRQIYPAWHQVSGRRSELLRNGARLYPPQAPHLDLFPGQQFRRAAF